MYYTQAAKKIAIIKYLCAAEMPLCQASAGELPV
jgi:hypothetical protein